MVRSCSSCHYTAGKVVVGSFGRSIARLCLVYALHTRFVRRCSPRCPVFQGFRRQAPDCPTYSTYPRHVRIGHGPYSDEFLPGPILYRGSTTPRDHGALFGNAHKTQSNHKPSASRFPAEVPPDTSTGRHYLRGPATDRRPGGIVSCQCRHFVLHDQYAVATGGRAATVCND